MKESSQPSSEGTLKTKNTQLEIEDHPDARSRRQMLLASLQDTQKRNEKNDTREEDDWTIIHNY